MRVYNRTYFSSFYFPLPRPNSKHIDIYTKYHANNSVPTRRRINEVSLQNWWQQNSNTLWNLYDVTCWALVVRIWPSDKRPQTALSSNPQNPTVRTRKDFPKLIAVAPFIFIRELIVNFLCKVFFPIGVNSGLGFLLFCSFFPVAITG